MKPSQPPGAILVTPKALSAEERSHIVTAWENTWKGGDSPPMIDVEPDYQYRPLVRRPFLQRFMRLYGVHRQHRGRLSAACAAWQSARLT